MSLDEMAAAFVTKYDGALSEFRRAGISMDHFVDEGRVLWRYILRSKKEHDEIPSADMLQARFPDLSLPRVRRNDKAMIIHDLHQRRRWLAIMRTINEVAGEAHTYEDVDVLVAKLQQGLNRAAFRNNGKHHLVDLFSQTISDEMIQEVMRRRESQIAGLPTGLKRFDNICGGLQRQRMVTIIGRTGKGKSWLNLLFVANAVSYGAKVLLYPLEMTLSETAFRLYTLFTQMHFGADRVIRNYDLTMGKTNPRTLTKALTSLSKKFGGQLIVADMGRMSDPYTIEKIEAEVEAHRPDLFWVDYLTLLSTPGRKTEAQDWQNVRSLSSGVKLISMRQHVIGGCSAQVNREGIRGSVFLPRLEHIAYGDSIGADSDQVFSINRKDNHLYYALVKNRNGPEIGMTRVKFQPDEGLLEETDEQEDDKDD